MIHALKTWSTYFQAVLDGGKNFELRRFDRPFKVGDKLLLQEWQDEYTGREVMKKIVYILSDTPGIFGLRPGFCILGLEALEDGK